MRGNRIVLAPILHLLGSILFLGLVGSSGSQNKIISGIGKLVVENISYGYFILYVAIGLVISLLTISRFNKKNNMQSLTLAGESVRASKLLLVGILVSYLIAGLYLINLILFFVFVDK